MLPHENTRINQLLPLYEFVWTWAFNIFVRLPFDKIALFTGNQAMKTAGCAYQYVLRIMGWHPIPKKNVLYFECPQLVEEEDKADKDGDDDCITHPWVSIGLPDGSRMNIHREGQYFDSVYYPNTFPARLKKSLRPEDNKCSHCGNHLQIHERKSRIFRFASEVLPGSKETTSEDGGQSTEVRNAVYPEFKKWLPRFLIKKDITARNTGITLYDPNSGHNFGGLEYKGGDIVAEFVAYHQTVQSGAGVQRISCWGDEEPPIDFYEEQMPRLVAEDGDFINSLTPANKSTWTFDEIFERGQFYVRTNAIREFLKKTDDSDVKDIEWTENNSEIAVIQAATDDNPTLSRKAIEKKYIYDDPDTVATRRYGIFKQATGRIFNDFMYKTHVINMFEYFDDGLVPEGWVLARSIDFHERNPWAVIWIALSPNDEAFVYHEWNPSPNKWVNLTIAREMADRSGMQRYVFNLIDPQAKKIQTNTGISTVEDLNRIFFELKREGICLGGYWEPFATQGTKGRDEIKKRLKNSLLVEKPFNNFVVQDGIEKYLPTLWISKKCPETAKSLRQWRYEEFDSKLQANRDKKETPAQKFSHFCTALEGVFKDDRFRPRRRGVTNSKRKTPRFFKAA